MKRKKIELKNDDLNKSKEEFHFIGPQITYVNGKIEIIKSSLNIYFNDKIKKKIIKKKRVKSIKWSQGETDKFYKALQVFGTDFTMVTLLLPGRNRKQVMNKFHKEERVNLPKINLALNQTGTYTFSDFQFIYGNNEEFPINYKGLAM